MLFLLAIKSPANRELLAWLERTSVAPVAAQLTNAEAYQNKLRLTGVQAEGVSVGGCRPLGPAAGALCWELWLPACRGLGAAWTGGSHE
jgi:hypothetical protein